MSDPIVVVAGATDPEYFTRVVLPNPNDPQPPNYSLATSARFALHVGGAITYWPATIVSQATGSATIQHTFAADGSDVPAPANIHMLALVTVNGIEIRHEPFILQAVAV